MELKLEFDIIVTDEDIDDIMASALEGGINYWCGEAEVIGERLGEEGWAHEQIARGGTLRLHDVESDDCFDLYKENFLTGLKKYLEHEGLKQGLVYDEYKEGPELDCSMIDAVAADLIIQYALFGEVVYG